MELFSGPGLGDLEFDPAEGVLRRAGEPVPLRPLATAALALLVRHRGRLVTREELHRELWGETVVVDYDASLNQVMRQIRSALGDDARTPRLLETVPRRGYRLREATPERRRRLPRIRARDFLAGAALGIALPILIILACAFFAAT